jgi:ribonuclease HII
MAQDFSKLSLEEIRRRFLDDGHAISPRLLKQLQRDTRQGARRAYEVLKRRYERKRGEWLRLDSMLNFERVLWKSGVCRIAGVDEVGIGPLAGPVVAAAVVFPPGAAIAGIDDSKRLDPERREALAAEIRAHASSIGIGLASEAEIDTLNVYRAGLLAMQRAIDALPAAPEHVLTDARTVPQLAVPQNAFNKGDGINFSIAAASIIAKTHRDRLMQELDPCYAGYGFARHKGYGTAEHQHAIRALGPCAIHRMSFPVIRELCGEFSEIFYAFKAAIERVHSARELKVLEQELEARCERLAEAERHKLRLVLARRWKLL